MKINKIQFIHQPEMDEIEETIEDQTYYLVPESHIGLRTYFEKKNRYTELNRVSKKMFERQAVLRESAFTKNLHTRVKNVIPADLCKVFIEQADKVKEAIYHADFMNKLLPMILSEEIDSYICSHFESEYTLYWYTYLETEPDRENRSYSSYWHCDGGPEKHLKLLIYLNGYKEHQGNTKFLDQTNSTKLKQVGYIFNDINKRTENIGPLCRKNDIEINEVMYEDIEAGDGLLFNPNQLAHIGKIPELATRKVLQLCFIPSPFHWKHTKEDILYTQTGCADFEEAAKTLLDWTNRKPGDIPERIMVPMSGDIVSAAQLKLMLHNMYADNNFADTMFERLMEADPNLQHLNTVQALLETLKISFKNSIDWAGDLGLENIRNLAQLAKYETEFKDSISRYAANDKPVPSAVFWPSPDHPSKPSTKFGLFPYVKKHPIMGMDTPIGSAGSCFAFEIARVFQEMGYNYLITERNDDPASGIAIDGYKSGDKYAKFCANYGILFNTPSFRQLAERAFDIKPTKQILFEQDGGSWVDPYRENVMFYSHEAYFNDYDRHIEATRNALEQVEVFIITLGLNECWQFRDGTVMSRNPRGNMYPLVTHKTLTVQENVDNIQTFFDICKKHNPEFKLIISVSPIPFLATGRAADHHVISANTHSKAVLRVAAEELVQNNEEVYYLPSYELVTECLEDAWHIDQRHVKPETVEQVVKMFKEMFIKE